MKFIPVPRHGLAAMLVAGGFALLAAVPAMSQQTISLTKIGGYASGIFGAGGAEIVAHDPKTQRLFVINAQAASIDVLNVAIPSSPALLFSIDVTPYGGGVNSVAVDNGVVAAAVEDTNRQANGRVVFFNTNGVYISQVTVGALPDMLTFTPNGQYLLVANEGEPNAAYTVDPEGTVSIIDMKGGASSVTQSDVRTVSFTGYNDSTLDASIRIFGPGATVAEDLEPEYITVSHNSKTAWVTLQENNAIAIIDIKGAKALKLAGLGFKDHSVTGNELDASDRDNIINIKTWPVLGMYLPDGIASYKYRDDTYLVLANEGDARAYTGFNEETRVGSVTLDPVAFPNAATLRTNPNLGRLRITNTRGDANNDGKYEQLYSFGGRSFSIRREDGTLVFDSGDDLERITALAYPTEFNSTHDANGSFDTRSDDKGPEPEGVAIGKISGRYYAFIVLERIGGVAVYDIDNPNNPAFVQYINTRIFTGNAAAGTAGDLGPEGIAFIDAADSPTRNPLLAVGNEISGTTAIFEIATVKLKKPSVGGLEFAERAAFGEIAPNPASSEITIPFTLSAESKVTITVADLAGRSVSTLTSATYSTGAHQETFSTSALQAGTYFCRLEVDGVVQEVRKVVIVR